MEYIFHEKQEGSLCAQHCLNALLQGSYFTAVDLADMGKELDERERSAMREAPAGAQSQDYLRFIQEESSNFDDSGFFSIQVITTALEHFGLSLVRTGSAEAAHSISHPDLESAFICNMNQHWFSIRKLGSQWFNLDSMKKAPQYISSSFLSVYLAQLAVEGYSIFVVRGDLPSCEADQVLTLCPYDPSSEQATKTSQTTNKRGNSPPAKTADAETVRNKRLLYLQKGTADGSQPSGVPAVSGSPEPDAASLLSSDQDEELQKAIQLSLLTK